MKVATTVNIDPKGTGAPTSKAGGVVRSERFTSSQVTTPGLLADVLTRLNKAVQEIARGIFSMRASHAVTFENVTVGGGGAKVRLPHNLGVRAQWAVVGWRGAGIAAAPILVSDELDATAETTTALLVLRSYQAGIADIEVR